MSVILAKAYADLTTRFPQTWADQFIPIGPDNPNDATTVLQLQTAMTGGLESIANELFDNLNYSVLSGEYVSDIDACEQLVEQLENYIKSVGAQIDFPLHPQMTFIAQDVFQSYFYVSAKELLKYYRKLLYFVNRHLVHQPNSSTLFYITSPENSKARTGNEAAKQSAELFRLNTQLSEVDHSLTFSKQFFTRLILLQDVLDKLTPSSPLAEILYKKCSFLLYKISARLKETRKEYLYGIDFKLSAVGLVEIPDFDLFNQIINGHYGITVNTPLFDQRLRNALNKIDQQMALDLGDYHALIKHYKDELHDLGKLQHLKTLYQPYYQSQLSSTSKFDRKALDITFCYLLNNILSLELEKKQFNLANWETKFKYYTDEADRYKNKNFFPYYKIVKEFLIAEISRLLKEKDSDLIVLGTLIDDYKTNLKSLSENLQICENTDYLTFQNNYQNCLTTLHDSTGRATECFVASSFVLPLYYGEYREELEFFKAESYKFDAMLEIQQMMVSDRGELNSVKQEMKNTDKRNIEILSIFAALVMFVSNEIQIFGKVANMADAVAYSLFFAFGLSLFVMLIWLITRPEGLKKDDFKLSHKIGLTFYIVGLLAAIAYVSFIKFADSPEKKLSRMQFKIDSLKKIRTFDTLQMPVPKPKLKTSAKL
ncbi:hypothetical protein AB6735_23110 [Mucilaginibacter sp. RCC_168]|uniref:hypothetical protein n=1 Tax=Mucilaginibacter sp. RCC_168 TaxID=3239221 RepID=UPI0035246E82